MTRRFKHAPTLLPYLLGLTAILLFALWLRWPGIGMGLPYFYREDEAHHFNRVVEMVKEQRLDPEYFHKPSLHFYLRMPVVYAAFWYLKQAGAIGSMREVVTRDPFGLAGYAFAASHPTIVKWNRALSVFLCLALIVFGAACARRLSDSNVAALGTALVLAVSPPLIDNAPIIGVDVLMALCCTATVYFALRGFDSGSKFCLFLSCVAGGLAVSSKYNALPVIVVPALSLALDRNYRKADWMIAVTVPIIVFFATSPFILVNASMFMEHLRYEVWHYAVAGHAGHTAERGWPQLVYYVSWLNREGVGFAVLVTAAAAILAMGVSMNRRKALFLYFPLTYLLMMVLQRANFERNMLVILPFVAALSFWVIELFWSNTAIRRSGKHLTAILCCLQPLWLGVEFRKSQIDPPESRIAAERIVRQLADGHNEIALSGQLRFPRALGKLPGVRAINQDRLNPAALYLGGFDYLVLGPGQPEAEFPAYLAVEHEIPGSGTRERITINPEIKILKFIQGAALEQAVASEAARPALVFSSDPKVQCAREGEMPAGVSEGHCWLDRRMDSILVKFPSPATSSGVTVVFEMMSPWQGQSLEMEVDGVKQSIDFTGVRSGDWLKFSQKFPVALHAKELRIKFRLGQVHAPKNLGLSEDVRRLGLAIKTARVF